MRSLGKTISALAGHRRLWEKRAEAVRRAQAKAPRRDPGRSRLTEVTDFGSNPGALRMFTHVPPDLGRLPALVVVLHGCTQSAEGYDLGAGWSTLADRYGFALLFPEQTPANNPNTCFTWFQPEDTARDCGEALSIRQMVETMAVHHGIDRSRVFVTGLSAGGAMTSVMLAAYPDVFAAGAIICGLPYGTANNIQEAFESMFNGRHRAPREWGDLVRKASPHRGPWPRVSVWHGDCDATVKQANADNIVKQWLDIHGVASAPTEGVVDGYPRQVWRCGEREVIESYTIAGMSHGTPLSTDSADEHKQCGEAGPYFLEVGIASSYHIAKFFGLTGSARVAAAHDVRQAAMVARQPAEAITDERVEAIADERVEILNGDADAAHTRRKDTRTPGPLDISGIITKALTAAGLMKPPASGGR